MKSRVRPMRAARVLVAATVCSLAGVVMSTPAAQAGTQFGGEVVIIDHVGFGSSLATNACGLDGQAALPMTITATFINLNGGQPTGPYATGEWSGGFGSDDDHFGSSQAHDTTQTFHILLRSGALQYYGAVSTGRRRPSRMSVSRAVTPRSTTWWQP